MSGSGNPFDNERPADPSAPENADPVTNSRHALFAEAEAAAPVARPEPYSHLPEDLRVPWTWLDLLLFFFFAIGCLFIVGRAFFLVAAVVVGVPRGADGGMVIPNSWQVLLQLIWFAVLLGYLYLLVRIRFKTPFWQTLGFRPMLKGEMRGGVGTYAAFAFTGMLLAVAISALSGLVRPVGEIPMERLFQQRESAILVLFAAVVVAPVMEELLFRGWLYPVVARTFGVTGGVLITGTLFGMMHGAQLGWHWQLVGLLTAAGVVFSYFRARTGSVLPSYFLHLGYNCVPVLGFLVQTSGLQNLPGAK